MEVVRNKRASFNERVIVKNVRDRLTISALGGFTVLNAAYIALISRNFLNILKSAFMQFMLH